MFCRSSFRLGIKFVPLSNQKTEGIPRRSVNFSISITQLLMSIEGTTSKCTARVVKQVNRNHHLFAVDLFTETKNGPKVVYAGVGKRWFLEVKSFSWKVSRHRTDSLSSTFATSNTSLNYRSQGGSKLDDGDLLLHRRPQVVHTLVTMRSM